MNSLFDLFVKIGADDSEFQRAINDSTNKTDGLGVKAIAMGQMLADAFEMGIKKAVEFGKAVVDVGIEQEASLAKVATIMDKTVMNTEAMDKGIRDLSSSIGVSVAELSDTVYNAISATGDTEGSLILAEKASKLAIAGYTDTTSALSVMTTAMNAYNLSADDATKLSDGLMTVQNRGVTTVAELSSSMGKAIATAGAYNVSLDNLESAYISATKQGINTAETTTYISSMLKELGDSGSDVGEVIKGVTGKSFGQLMNDGASLADVLDLLLDSVDGDKEALMNLWGSAEAGKVANAILKQGTDYFRESLDELGNSAGTTEEAYAIMADTMEHKTAVFKENIANKMAELFESIEPILIKLMDVFEKKIMPVLDKAVDKFDELAPVIADKVEPVIDNLVTVLTDFVIPVVSEIIKNLDIIIPVLAGVVAGIKAFSIVKSVTTWITALKTGFALFNAVLLANPIGLIIGLLAGIIVTLVTLWNTSSDFRKFVQNIWEGVKKLGSDIARAFSEITSKMLEIGKNIVQGLWNGIKNKWTGFIDDMKSKAKNLPLAVQKVLGIASPSKVFRKIGEYCAEGFEEGMEDFANPDGALKNLNSTMDAIEKGATADFEVGYSASMAGVSGATGSGRLVEVCENMLAVMAQYLPEVANMKLVTDTGALVGAIAPQMDAQLGIIAQRKARG